MELKNKGSEVTLTTDEAIANKSQSYGTNDSSPNQGPKHISFYLGRVMEKMNTQCFYHDSCIFQELASLAEKMESDCYSEEKSSKEIIRDFFNEVKNLRDSQ